MVVSHLEINTETLSEHKGDKLAERSSENFDTKDMKTLIIDAHSHSNNSAAFVNVIIAQTGEYLSNMGEKELNLTIGL